jgi:ribosome-associated protein
LKANSQAKTKAKQQQALIDLIVESIHDKKGLKVISLNLSELNDSMADHFIICEGTSAPHMRAIADNVTYKVKHEAGLHPYHTEGINSPEWVLVDYFDVLVHIFHKDKRELYQLEDLWGDAKSTQHEPIPDNIPFATV